MGAGHDVHRDGWWGALRLLNLMLEDVQRKTSNRTFSLQGMMVTEMWVDRIARTLGMTPEAVRAANMYDEADTTHYGQELDACQVKPCWEQVRESTLFPGDLSDVSLSKHLR